MADRALLAGYPRISCFTRFHEENPLAVVSSSQASMHESNWSAETAQEDIQTKLAGFLPLILCTQTVNESNNVWACGIRYLAIHKMWVLYIDGIVQERCNAIANALELCLSFTDPSIYSSSFPQIMTWLCSALLDIFEGRESSGQWWVHYTKGRNVEL